MLKTMLFRGTGISGSESWVLDFSGGRIEGLSNICISKKGTLYIGGSERRRVSSDNNSITNFFMEIDAEGKILWQNYFKHKTNDSVSDNGCITTIGNNIVVGGQDHSPIGLATRNTQLGLYSANGVELATAGIKGTSILGNSIAIISDISSNDDNIYAYGTNYVAKLAKDLSNADWIKSFTKIKTISIKCDPYNDCIYFCSDIKPSDDSSNTYFCVGSISSVGEQIWLKRINGSTTRLGICVTSDGIYACGKKASNNDQKSTAILAKYTKSGSLLWIKEIVKNSTHLTPYGIGSDITGNIYIGGVTSDGFLAKLSSDGVILPNGVITLKSTTSYPYRIGAIKTDTKGNVYFLTADSNGSYLVKLTKNDMKQIATTTLTIGPLTFENNSSIEMSSSSLTTEDDSNKFINTSSTNFSLTSSTFTATKANLTPILYYKG